MKCDVIDVNSAPGKSAKESSYFYVHAWKSVMCHLLGLSLSPCFGRLCLHVTVVLAWLLHKIQQNFTVWMVLKRLKLH